MENSGTIKILGDYVPTEVRCPYRCGDDDISVNTKTGICSECGREFTIHTAQIIVAPIEQTSVEVTV